MFNKIRETWHSLFPQPRDRVDEINEFLTNAHKQECKRLWAELDLIGHSCRALLGESGQITDEPYGDLVQRAFQALCDRSQRLQDQIEAGSAERDTMKAAWEGEVRVLRTELENRA